MPHPSQDWWEVSQMGHSSYDIHLQASALLHSSADLEQQSFLRRKPMLALLLEMYIFGILLVQTELRSVFRNPSERLCVHLSLLYIPEDEA